MDRRSWPWKKKSSEKTAAATDTNSASLSISDGNKQNQEDAKAVNYVQISVESYAHLTELEGQVKVLNEKVSTLNEKLTSAQSEMVTKESLVKQHAKVAEEAVSGWEKAEAEALALKNQLESVTLLKLTVEDRASHLDGALKECMKQVRNVKEESEQKLHDVVFAKTKQWEKAKAELEANIVDFEQELMRSSADNAALSRSLQERSNLLIKISDEKSQAEDEIEMLKNDVQSCEREINSLKYELHVVSKELDIRNEEKNMSVRSADVANKQHLEDVKKIAKLEAECQRLRGLVRKKLPGPAALAQMKLEVENLGRDYGETRLRHSPAKSSSPHHLSPSDFALENMQQCQKENEFLTARLLTMEEEMKMLKEALSKRNSELQASRNMCAKTANKLHSIEAHIHAMNQQKSPTKSVIDIPLESESNPPSLTSMSEDGIDEEGSCSESWATTLMSGLSQFKKENHVDKGSKSDISNHLETMDDFLEMERLACLSTETNGNVSISAGDLKAENVGPTSTVVSEKEDCNKQPPPSEPPTTSVSCNVNQPAVKFASNTNDFSLSKLQSSIACIFESQSQNMNMGKVIEDIKCIIHDAQEKLCQHSEGCDANETHSMDDTCMQKEGHEDKGEVTDGEILFKQDASNDMDQDLKDAILQIHEFVLSLGQEAAKIPDRSSDDQGLSEKIEEFSVSVNKFLCSEVSLHNFILSVSHILAVTSVLSSTILSGKSNEREINSSDCIDKVTLLENKVAQHEHAKERLSGVCTLPSHSSSDPEIEGPVDLGFELKTTLQKCSLEEFEQMKLEKQNTELDLARCKETLEITKLQLVETEQCLEELKSQLADSQKSNSLAETQLRCMAESYKSLESRMQELETEMNLLRTRAEMLGKELQDEKLSHQGDLAKYKELQEQVERNKCSTCSLSLDADIDINTKQEKDIAAAAEKLAECQETIFLLGRQLNSLRPPAEMIGSSPNITQLMTDSFLVGESIPSGFINSPSMLSPQHLDHAETENLCTPAMRRTGGESPLNGYSTNMCPSDSEASSFPRSPSNSKRQKYRSSRSSSSSSSSNTVEKHGRGISRFFSKGKNDH